MRNIWKYHIELLTAIAKGRLNPLLTSKCIFLFTTIGYNSQSFFKSNPNFKYTDDFPEHNVYIKNDSYFRKIIEYALYIIDNYYIKSNTLQCQYDSNIEVNDSCFDSFNEAIKVINEYFETRKSDGWNDNTPIDLPNGEQRVIPHREQDFSKFNDKLKWTPIYGYNPLGANWGKVRGVISQDKRNEIINIFDELHKSAEKKMPEEIIQVLNVSQELTDEQKMIAEFWAGGPGTCTPPGMFDLFLTCYFANNNTDISTQFAIYQKLGIGLFEASIIAWELKYKYFQARPIQTIRHYFSDTNINHHYGQVKGKYWCPYQSLSFITPPFPDTPSGHSIFSKVASVIISKCLSDDIIDNKNIQIPISLLKLISPIFKDIKTNAYLHNIPIFSNTSEICNVLPKKNTYLKFKTWTELALQAGESRIFGGIHYPSSNTDSSKIGEILANHILDMSSHI